jgi:hypothetical protein
MSLTVDSRNVNENVQSDTIRTLAFCTLMIGMNEITPKNAMEFTWRLTAIAPEVTVDGYSSIGEAVTQCVGLKTNTTTMTMAQFRAHFLRVKLPKFRR